MFYIISCKVSVGTKQMTEVFVCPTKWIKNGILYWPSPEKKVQPKVQCQNWQNYKFNKNWTRYNNFKILRNKHVFANFDEASVVEAQELQNPTELSSSSSCSDSEDETTGTSAKPKVEGAPLQIPQILKRPMAPSTVPAPKRLAGDTEVLDVHNLNETTNEDLETVVEDEEVQIDAPGSNESVNTDNISTFPVVVTENTDNISTFPVVVTENPVYSLQQVFDQLLQTNENDGNAPVLEIISDSEQNYYEQNTNSNSSHETKIDLLIKLVKTMAVQQIRLEKKFDDIVNMLVNPNNANSEILEGNKIPVDSIEGLINLNDQLCDIGYKEALMKALCNKHIDKRFTLHNIILAVLNSLVTDDLLKSFTYTGDSKLTTKTNKLTDFKNICAFFKDIFAYAGKSTVNKYAVPLDKDVEKALSYTVRHASERVDRKEKNLQKKKPVPNN